MTGNDLKAFKFDSQLLLIFTAASPGRHNLVRRQVATQTTTKIPPANPEIPTVFKVSCNCPFLSHYNPVCGSDGQTYGNNQILECARSCGASEYFDSLF